VSPTSAATLFAVSDFADFMGQGVTPDHAECRLLIPHHDFGVNAALLVRGTLGLKNINRYQLRSEAAIHPWAARQYADEAGIGCAIWISGNCSATPSSSRSKRSSATDRTSNNEGALAR